MALTVEKMFYGVWCHSTLRTNVCYAAGDVGLVTQFKSRQWPECNWASVVRTDRGSRLSSGEISGGEAPRTLFGTKFVFVVVVFTHHHGEQVWSWCPSSRDTASDSTREWLRRVQCIH